MTDAPLHVPSRGWIQDELTLYEHRKHDGTLPIIGVNTFRAPDEGERPVELELARGTETEKQSQLARLADFHTRHHDQAHHALARLRQVVADGCNVFAELMHASRVCSLGQITDTFFDIGGQYRRNV